MAKKKQTTFGEKVKSMFVGEAAPAAQEAAPIAESKPKPKPKKKKKKTKGHVWKGQPPAGKPAGKKEATLAELEQRELQKAARERVPPNPHLKRGVQQNVNVSGSKGYLVYLAGRHAEWLERCAAMEKRSPESMIERIIRAGYASDPSKGGMHEAAAGTSFLAEDLGKITR